MIDPRKFVGPLAVAVAFAAFAAGWAAPATLSSRPTQPPAPRFVASREEKILAARVLVAINKRRPGVVTPPEVIRLAESTLPHDRAPSH